jgi:hypothetical protein
MAWKMAPALAAGNTYIYKGSEKSPYSLLVFARLFKEAGFPPGVVNILTGDGVTGALMASHMDIDKISFTGSGLSGRKVADAASKSNMKKVTLELGGKSPAVVFEDANIENALIGYATNLTSISICVVLSFSVTPKASSSTRVKLASRRLACLCKPLSPINSSKVLKRTLKALLPLWATRL